MGKILVITVTITRAMAAATGHVYTHIQSVLKTTSHDRSQMPSISYL